VIFHHFDRFLAEYDFHPHLHHLVTEGGVDAAAASPVLMNMSAGVFHEIPRMDDLRLAEILAREVLAPEGKVGFRWGRDGVEQEMMEAPAIPCLRAGCAHGGRGERGLCALDIAAMMTI
jgi:hypothetical protein